eukprot:jgi/Botrbrau1/13873/Bobra.0056s0105.1
MAMVRGTDQVSAPSAGTQKGVGGALSKVFGNHREARFPPAERPGCALDILIAKVCKIGGLA